MVNVAQREGRFPQKHIPIPWLQLDKICLCLLLTMFFLAFSSAGSPISDFPVALKPKTRVSLILSNLLHA